MSYLTLNEIKKLGFKKFGENVLISNKASFYNTQNIEIGNNVRIDDFCILSAGYHGIKIGDYIHIAIYSSIIGKEKVEISDFCNISSRVSIYSSNDDYSGKYLTSPILPDEYTNIISSPVTLGKHTIIGSGCVILPGVILEDGVAAGALSLIKQSFPPFSIIAGRPARIIKMRDTSLLQLEKKYLATIKNKNE